jgi:RNA polymerase sigma-70 factor (ECF subfamily)
MEAEDVMQEAFLVAFRAMTKIDLSISFGGWLKRIVINRSVDALRKERGYWSSLPTYPKKLIIRMKVLRKQKPPKRRSE